MDFRAHVEKFSRRFAEIEAALTDPKVFDNQARARELGKEYDRLKDLVTQGAAYVKTIEDLEENRALLQDQSLDSELVSLAEEEIKRLEAAGQYDNPRYMQLLIPHHYVQHILRMPPDQWPDPVNRTFKHLNTKIYIPMQGPSELGASGKLANWDRTADLGKITVPTLVVGARYDTMDPSHLEKMAGRVKNGRYHFCPNGSHLAIYDDQKVYMEGIIRFIGNVDARRF
jgi:proline iminopeptidase